MSKFIVLKINPHFYVTTPLPPASPHLLFLPEGDNIKHIVAASRLELNSE